MQFSYHSITLISILSLPSLLTASDKPVAPGLYYQHRINKNPAQSIHILTADPACIDIKIGIADDKCASAQKTSSIALAHRAIAAINGGFFDFGCKNSLKEKFILMLDCLGYSSYYAFPVFTLTMNNTHYAISNIFTGAIGWNNHDQCPVFTILNSTATFTINGNTYTIQELNKPSSDKLTLYEPSYNIKTPFFYKPVSEIIIENNIIKKISSSSHGKKKIPRNGAVICIPKKEAHILKTIKENDPITIQIINTHRTTQTECDTPKINNMNQPSPNIHAPYQPTSIKDLNSGHATDPTKSHYTYSPLRATDNILASTPLLILNKKIIDNLATNTTTFYTDRHPRSAVGVLENGHWIFVAVDGRSKQSVGLTIVELAELMLQLGCVNALNLDGGGSTTMVINNKIVNTPSGREYCLVRKERPISTALLLCAKSKNNS